MLVLLADARRQDHRHTTGWALSNELKRKQVGDLGVPPVAAAGEHITAQEQVDERPQMALWRRVAMGSELAADPLELLLAIRTVPRMQYYPEETFTSFGIHISLRLCPKKVHGWYMSLTVA